MRHTVPESLVDLYEPYVDALIAGNAGEAQRLIDEALRVAPIASVYRALLVEGLYEVGRRWERGAITVAEEHLASGICEVVLPDLAQRLPRGPRTRRTAIIACVPGELHAIGSRIVADVLEAAGWDVLYLGALTPAAAMVELVVSRGVDVVALSASCAERIPEIEDVCARLRELPRSPLVVVGGQAFAGAAEAPDDACLLVDSPEALVAALAERFAPAAR
jgi:MerR family transcriptional regulator, light-induced transcriptional regulator